MMKNEVIRIPDENENAEIKNPVVYTHEFNVDVGWEETQSRPKGKVVYLGHCLVDGDMFAQYTAQGIIDLYKGHLNSGKY